MFCHMELSRRQFIAGMTAAGAAWLAAGVACRERSPDALTHHPDTSAEGETGTLTHFNADDAADVEAAAARIFPTDDTPGAREAGVIFFIDRCLTTFMADAAPLFAEGITSLNRSVATRFPGVTRFAALTDEQQDTLLRSIESTEFFGSLRFATIAGMFALPRYGGNRDYIGWKLVDQQSVFEYVPPFGWYDHPDNQQALLGRVL